jgi:hypothetical protein
VAADASSRPTRWDEATRDAAPLLRDRTCVVIVGELDEDAAHAALALAHAHIRTRRVAIVDAVGELAPLQKLLPRDAQPHGVIDHFLHGVSLRKIAQPVNREGTLFVLPSGAGPFEYDTLLRRERWRRMTMAFRGEGALLCIVLPRDADGLAAFVEDTDGIVLVGDVEYPEARHVIARVPRIGRASADASVVPVAPTARAGFFSRVTRQARPKRAVLLAGSVFALVAVGALFAWDRGDDAGDAGSGVDRQAAAVSAEAQLAGAVAAAENDSASAALYSVDIVMVSSLTDATHHLSDRLAALPAATFSPVRLGADSSRWYRLLVGAWREQRQADSALLALRDAGVLEMGFGSVRRTPFAVRVADGVSPTTAMTRATELRAQGFPAYALGRDGDHAGVYAGAFETPSQAMPLLDMFKRAGIDATVAYRIGRGI